MRAHKKQFSHLLAGTGATCRQAGTALRFWRYLKRQNNIT